MASSEQSEQSSEAATLDAAMQAHQQGNLTAANRLYSETVRLNPDNAQALRLQGILARETGDLDTSLELLHRAHSAAPDATAPLNELALSQMIAGRFPDAEATFHQALNLDPQDRTALTNLGALLQHRGHIRAAIDCYRTLLQQQPEDIEVSCNLAKALVDAGEPETALQTCDAVIATSAAHPYALATKGAVLTDLERYPAALEVLQSASRQMPDDDMTLVNLALCQDALDQTDAAIASLQQAIEQNPFNARAIADLSNCLVKLGAGSTAVQLCEQFLAQYPGECLVLGSYALALAAGGHSDQAGMLTNCERLVKTFELELPGSAVPIEKFNEALAIKITGDTSLLSDPASKSTFGGSQTGELDFNATAELRELADFFNRSIKSTFESYIADGLADHPVLARQDRNWSLRGWGTVLHSGGRQSSHMHPLGWLSGVYYVQVPEAMQAEGEHAGALEFGIAPERFYQPQPSGTCFLPQAGRLVLFPSWFWHRTVPFAADDERISIAFDVMPDNALRML